MRGGEGGDDGAVRYAHCRAWAECASVPTEVECPPTLRYPPPPSPVHILFVGWNPPGDHHVWEGTSDPLRDDLATVFMDLGWRGYGDFRQVLLDRHCYFVHAVKCWRAVEPPSSAAIRRCSPLLARDIADLKPVNLCILGLWAHGAACLVIPDLPSFDRFNYGVGWNGEVAEMNVIITTFANWHLNRGQNKLNRECVADALRRWVR